MRILDPGHQYVVANYPCDGGEPIIDELWIGFVKKIGERFPGNEPPESNGTNCQELLRVIINRCLYLNDQKPSPQTVRIIELARTQLYLFEYRAAELKGKLQDFFIMSEIRSDLIGIENVKPCTVCGHIYPHGHAKEET
jgi:hypothetical protein